MAHSEARTAAAPVERSGGWYPWYVVFALGLVYTLSVIDRNLLAILQEPMRRDLGLSDFQLGILSGLAFALFYAAMALPLSRLADRMNRVVLVSSCLTLWSVMTLGCGLAPGFVLLLLFRMGVGIGEAGGYPASASIVSEYFRADRRATALSVLGLGLKGGAALGLLIGGILNELIGWRLTFVTLGGAGVILAAIVFATVREPERGMQERLAADAAGTKRPETKLEQPSFWESLHCLWRLPSQRYLVLGNAIVGTSMAAFAAWTPSYFVRTFDLRVGDVGAMLGTISLILASIGIIFGARVAEILSVRDKRWFVLTPAAGAFLLTPAAIAMYLAPNVEIAFVFAGICYFFMAFLTGPIMGASLSLVSPSIRAFTAAVFLVTYSIIGTGIGPALAGAVNTILSNQAGLGEAAIRYSMSAMMLFATVGGTLFVISSRSIRADLARDYAADFARPPQAGGKAR